MDVFDLFGVEEADAPTAPRVVRDLADAVVDIEHALATKREPNLMMVAVAIQDILDLVGESRASVVASRWVEYEGSRRRASKMEEARARADAAYRLDLAAIQDGWEPLVKTEQSSLPWRKPDGQ
jgi:hypothetical protein